MVTEVKERPILFSGPMVRAILDGTKTQTRRIIKQQPTKPLSGYVIYSTEPNCSERFRFSNGDDDAAGEYRRCPYGHPGDRLWVREAWQQVEQDGASVKPRAELQPRKLGVCYRADRERCPITHGLSQFKWRPSIHMPRWASRITLEITGVRAERLHQISEADAQLEGFAQTEFLLARRRFELLWSDINGPKSWDLNPWVWVVDFKRTA